MNFKCPKCGKVFERDLRKTENQFAYSKKKKAYYSGCEGSVETYWCKETNEKVTE